MGGGRTDGRRDGQRDAHRQTGESDEILHVFFFKWWTYNLGVNQVSHMNETQVMIATMDVCSCSLKGLATIRSFANRPAQPKKAMKSFTYFFLKWWTYNLGVNQVSHTNETQVMIATMDVCSCGLKGLATV